MAAYLCVLSGLHNNDYGAFAPKEGKVALVVFLILYVPVYVVLRLCYRFSADWDFLQPAIAIFVTFGIVVGGAWLKDKIWG